MDEDKRKEIELQNFWNKVEKTDDNSCWLWQGSCHKYGYFFIRRDGKRITYKSHRYMWEITHNQTIPKGMYICHTCDNPPCCNPKHLFLGTPKDNARDRDLKGRSGSAILTYEKAEAIKQECNLIEIAKKYGVAPYTIADIISGKRWIR